MSSLMHKLFIQNHRLLYRYIHRHTDTHIPYSIHVRTGSKCAGILIIHRVLFMCVPEKSCITERKFMLFSLFYPLCSSSSFSSSTTHHHHLATHVYTLYIYYTPIYYYYNRWLSLWWSLYMYICILHVGT